MRELEKGKRGRGRHKDGGGREIRREGGRRREDWRVKSVRERERRGKGEGGRREREREKG